MAMMSAETLFIKIVIIIIMVLLMMMIILVIINLTVLGLESQT